MYKKRYHEAIIICGYIMCPKCMENGEYMNPKIPGKRRIRFLKKLKFLEENPCLVCFGGPDGKLSTKIKSRHVKWSKAEPRDSPDRKYKPWCSDDPAKDFLHFLLYETNPKYANYVMAHNGGQYDNILLARKIYDTEDLGAQIISRGNKIFQMEVAPFRGRNNLPDRRTMSPTKFLDSKNIIPGALKNMPKTLGLVDKKKRPMKDKGIVL